MKNDLLLKIARLAVPELKTLQVYDGDALKYIDTNLAGIKKAVRTAYDLGWYDAEQAAAKKRNKPKCRRR